MARPRTICRRLWEQRASWTAFAAGARSSAIPWTTTAGCGGGAPRKVFHMGTPAPKMAHDRLPAGDGTARREVDHPIDDLPIHGAEERLRLLVQRSRVVALRHRRERWRRTCAGHAAPPVPPSRSARSSTRADTSARAPAHDAAQRSSGDVHVLVAELVEQLRGCAMHAHRLRPGRHRRPSRPRGVERDRPGDGRERSSASPHMSTLPPRPLMSSSGRPAPRSRTKRSTPRTGDDRLARSCRLITWALARSAAIHAVGVTGEFSSFAL